jgi:hypothetical protein
LTLLELLEILTVILKITYEITTMNTFNRLLFYTALWSSFLYSYLPGHNFMSNDKSCSSLYTYESAYYVFVIRDYYNFKSCLVPFVTTESKSLNDVLLNPVSTKRNCYVNITRSVTYCSGIALLQASACYPKQRIWRSLAATGTNEHQQNAMGDFGEF